MGLGRVAAEAGITQWVHPRGLQKLDQALLPDLLGQLSSTLLYFIGHVRFIDYEYAGYNYQAFDIGNHFNEFAGVNEVDYCLYPARETQLQWLRYYLQAQKGMAVTPREVERLYVQVNKFALASHFFWALWALIQNQYSTIHFDFLR
nr:ethanolamine kinase 2-like isoform X2 [Macaca nemestrina]